MKKRKLEYIDYFRGLAILSIVAGHALVWGKPGEAIDLSTRFIFKGGTWLFVFIAGFLFQYLSYKFDLKTFYKKKILNVVCPYIVTLTPAVMLCTFCNNNVQIPFHGMSKLIQIPSYYAFGFLLNYPVWFMGMIFIIFLIAPLLLYINRNKIMMYSSLFISLTAAMCFNRPGLGRIMHYKLNTDITLAHRYLMYLLFYIREALFFLSVFLLGMFLCRYIEDNQDKIKFIARAILFYSSLTLLFLYILFVYKQVNFGQAIIRFSEIFFCLSLFICTENYIKNVRWLDKTLKFLAEYSFGIFFIHAYFINLLDHSSIYDFYGTVNDFWSTSHNSSSSLIHALIKFSFALFGSIITLWIVKKALNKIGVKNTRMFIGVESRQK